MKFEAFESRSSENSKLDSLNLRSRHYLEIVNETKSRDRPSQNEFDTEKTEASKKTTNTNETKRSRSADHLSSPEVKRVLSVNPTFEQATGQQILAKISSK